MEFRDFLSEEHTAIGRALEVLRKMVDRVERRVPTDRHDVNALLIFLHYFGDACHQAKEEAILFPILKSAEMSAASVKLELFQEDHSDQRDSIEAAQLALFTDNQDEFVATARKVVDLLSEHIEKEEQVLFPLAEQILTREKANQVAVKLHEADAKFGFTQRRLLMDLLNQLEEKYIRKAA